MKLNLSKAQATEIVNVVLSKNGFKTDVEAKVNIVVDNSGSMSELYGNGTVDALVNRALTIGDKFDDDGTINVFSFASYTRHWQHEDATQDNYGKYKIPYLGGATEYSPVLQRVVDFFFKGKKESTGGFLGMFKKTKVSVPEGRENEDDNYPVFTIFITDGETLGGVSDIHKVKKLLKSHEKDMFVSFVGISMYGDSFRRLKEIAAECPNADFYDAGKLSMTDEDLFKGILSTKAYNVLKG